MTEHKTFTVDDQVAYNSIEGWQSSREYSQPLTDDEVRVAMSVFENAGSSEDGSSTVVLTLGDIQKALPFAVAALVRARAGQPALPPPGYSHVSWAMHQAGISVGVGETQEEADRD